jgi:hypothetical protein
VSVDLLSHLASLPRGLASAISGSYRQTMDHYLTNEWDDAQVDAGRFCEAALRYLEWRIAGSYTAIDGKSKPNRKTVVGKARNDTNLAMSLRLQMPLAIELTMDVRNNRNSAHLGDVDANKMDATIAVANITWILGEIVRLETQKSAAEVQALLDRLAERRVPLIQTVNGTPIVLRPEMRARDKALVLLYQHGEAVPMLTVRKWVGYTHATKWRDLVVKEMKKEMLVYVDNAGNVTLLHPGEAEAERIILAEGGL